MRAKAFVKLPLLFHQKTRPRGLYLLDTRILTGIRFVCASGKLATLLRGVNVRLRPFNLDTAGRRLLSPKARPQERVVMETCDVIVPGNMHRHRSGSKQGEKVGGGGGKVIWQHTPGERCRV